VQVIAVSADSVETQKKFKARLGAPFPLVADPEAKLISLYGVKTPVVTFALRTTFVINQKGRVTSVEKGGDAIDPTGAAQAAARACGG
jgi:peroxiredoxin Q/BCP